MAVCKTDVKTLFFYFLTPSWNRYFFMRGQIFEFKICNNRRNCQSLSPFFLTCIATYVTVISNEKVFRWGLSSPVVHVKDR